MFMQEYESLCEKLKEISTLSGVNELLSWDEMVTYIKYHLILS